MKFTRVDLDKVNWRELDCYEDRTPFQRKQWLEYLLKITKGDPVVALLKCDHEILGCFTGLKVKFFGLNVLASPLKGTNTSHMGLNLRPGVSRVDALKALTQFAFFDLFCIYLEINDIYSQENLALAAGFSTSKSSGYLSDLTLTEDALFAGMSSACRRCIRKAEREGVIVEVANPTGFATEYYEQLRQVFSYQGLKPTYPETVVQALIDAIYPTGDMLLLRARASDGQSIATGIYIFFGNYSYFWGNGSVRDKLHLRPNQILHWYALRQLKRKGVKLHDWGGGGTYKREYGPKQIEYLTIYKSVIPFLALLRSPLLKIYYFIRSKCRN
jgi:hypothetical protein